MSAGADAANLAATGGLVLLGSVVPVVPTGPVFTAGVAFAASQSPLLVPVVFGIGVAACYLGDTLTFAATRYGGPRLVGWVRRRTGGRVVDDMVRRIDEQGGKLLMISRVVPAGRIPCLLAAGAAGFPWRGFAFWQLLGCVLWALLYGALGYVGGGLFTNPLVAVVVAVALVGLVQGAQALLRRRRRA